MGRKNKGRRRNSESSTKEELDGQMEDEGKWIACDTCHIWWKCLIDEENQDLKEEEFECGRCILKKMRTLVEDWNCEKKERNENLMAIKTEMAEMRKEINWLKEEKKKWDMWSTDYQEESQRNEERNDWVAKRRDESKENWNSIPIKEIRSYERGQIEEFKKIQKLIDKEKNLVIYGMRENNEDEEECKEIMRKLLKEDVNNNQIGTFEIKRLGKVETGKRPLLVSLQSRKVAQEALRRAKELRTDERYKKIFVDRDKTWEERELLREMRKEMMKNRRNNMFSIIKDGQVICKPFLEKGRKEKLKK